MRDMSVPTSALVSTLISVRDFTSGTPLYTTVTGYNTRLVAAENLNGIATTLTNTVKQVRDLTTGTPLYTAVDGLRTLTAGTSLTNAVIGMRDMTVTTTPLVSMLLSANNAVTIDGPYLIGSGGGSVWKNGWKAFDTTAGARQPRFWKVGGYCYFDGVVSAGSGASVVGSAVFNLPVAYRPNAGVLSSGYTRNFQVSCIGGAPGGQVYISSNIGDLIFDDGGTGWFSLDQVSYKCS
jgi:hypothetical protein